MKIRYGRVDYSIKEKIWKDYMKSMDDEECKDLHNDETEDYTISPDEDRNR